MLNAPGNPRRGSHRSRRVLARRVILLMAPLILVASMVLSARIGAQGVLYPLWALLLMFLVYAATHLPERYRWFGSGELEQAVDHRFGRFGRSYKDTPVDHGSILRAKRNERCPCGSELKYKKCCLERDLHGR